MVAEQALHLDRVATSESCPQRPVYLMCCCCMRAIFPYLLGILVALAVMVTPAQARSGHRSVWRCRPGHSHRIVSDLRAEVFEVSSGDEARYEGCAYGSTHRYALGAIPDGSSNGSQGSWQYTLAGTTLAFTEGGCPGALASANSSCWQHLTVMNLKNGRRLHRVSISIAPGCDGQVLRLVLKEDGAVAWIGINDLEGDCRMGTKTLEVHALESAGESLLASGTNISPASLALAGSTVYWMQGETAHSATLH